jgi:hypothetical protein
MKSKPDATSTDEATELVASPSLESTRVDPADDRPRVGSWWWVSSTGNRDESEYDRPGKIWLACVVEVGSNYAKVKGVRWSTRIALDHFYERCAAEPDPQRFIDEQVRTHKESVRALMGEIRQICHRLGVPMRHALAATTSETPSQALAKAHSVGDIGRYKKALVRAKEKTLPDLFNQIKEQHKQMAMWMEAELIPARADLAAAQEVTDVIEGKIHTVELYAGLTEELACVREGEPASIDERVRIMQRMAYMDEECLAQYEAGGMDFKDVDAFDAWLSREGNLARIFPSRRCIVAFRVRRADKEYPGLDAFIRFHMNEANRQTFLYIRNGEQLWRMRTSIDFGRELFPDQESSDLLGGDELWIKSSEFDIERGHGIITGRRRTAMIEEHKRLRRVAARRLSQWRKAGKPEKEAWTYVVGEDDFKEFEYRHEGIAPGGEVVLSGRPYGTWHHDNLDHPAHLQYELLTPHHVYHDDAMRRVQKAALEHNRIAVIVQGLLDRSACLHPHPPWRIWTPEGFASGVELSYDVSRAIAAGDAPDFEAYRRQLNRGIRAGCHTIGQKGAWRAHMEERHGEKWHYHSRWGNGPGHIHRVERVLRSGACEFRWTRRRVSPEWVPDPGRPGWRKATYPSLPCTWTCPASALTCVDAYTPGDFHLFFDDPRTRADYLQWAPILLACEDWHAKRRGEPGADAADAADEDDEDDEP